MKFTEEQWQYIGHLLRPYPFLYSTKAGMTTATHYMFECGFLEFEEWQTKLDEIADEPERGLSS